MPCGGAYGPVDVSRRPVPGRPRVQDRMQPNASSDEVVWLAEGAEASEGAAVARVAVAGPGGAQVAGAVRVPKEQAAAAAEVARVAVAAPNRAQVAGAVR